MSEDKQFVIWVGEEDHLRIMCMFKGTVLNDVFDRLQKVRARVPLFVACLVTTTCE